MLLFSLIIVILFFSLYMWSFNWIFFFIYTLTYCETRLCNGNVLIYVENLRRMKYARTININIAIFCSVLVTNQFYSSLKRVFSRFCLSNVHSIEMLHFPTLPTYLSSFFLCQFNFLLFALLRSNTLVFSFLFYSRFIIIFLSKNSYERLGMKMCPDK